MKNKELTVLQDFVVSYSKLALAFQQLNLIIKEAPTDNVEWIDEASPVVDMLEDGAKTFAKNFRKLIKLAREESSKNLT